MEKYLIIYGHKSNTFHSKEIIWKETKEEAENFRPLREDYVVFQIVYVPEGKGY